MSAEQEAPEIEEDPKKVAHREKMRVYMKKYYVTEEHKEKKRIMNLRCRHKMSQEEFDGWGEDIYMVLRLKSIVSQFLNDDKEPVLLKALQGFNIKL
jgi:hypothetical protein